VGRLASSTGRAGQGPEADGGTDKGERTHDENSSPREQQKSALCLKNSTSKILPALLWVQAGV
jgi:hypothetical protein